jgi:SAM-dependent MidA family methyltransferase
MTLRNIIIERIKKEGPIPFRDFMDMSLYYPGIGYYNSPHDKIGISGDYYTSPYATPLFGEIIAGQMEEMWHALDKPAFTIVEYGAGSGILCQDILHALKANTEMYDRLNYYIIEASPYMRDKEQHTLSEKVHWTSTIGNIPSITGCVLSNEVVDNFPVHLVVMQEELMEVFVDHQNDFTEILRPATPTLKDYLKELNINLPPGYRTEINLHALEWIKQVGAALNKGFVMTFDYGNTSSNLYSESKRAGTLACYHQHHLDYSPYNNIGEQDITAHVNFSALQHWGRQEGLEYCGFTYQSYFLRALGLVNRLKKIETSGKNDPTSEKERTFFLHTFLTDMGNKFKVLIQHKGIRQPRLSGLAFAQPLA